MPEERGTKDYVLDPTQYAFVLDATQGTVKCHVGPCRLDLADKDRPVIFKGGLFNRCKNISDAICSFPVAKDGDYVVLENPSKGEAHPTAGRGTNAGDLEVGRQVVLPGPVTFPLWAGQIATVISGHILRSNQYLVARVLNEEDARLNWGKQGVVKASTEPKGGETEGEEKQRPDTSPVSTLGIKPEDLTVGKEIVIKGTEVSFFIPPTGIGVKPVSGRYVLDAVTLERLEYCILVDEDGNKRFERGPQVVFPKPTETFVQDPSTKSRKFRAIELNEISGLYIKVIADYEEDDEQHHEGDELFITGDEQRLYWPRAEHAIIKYGSQERHFAVAVPAGEARYVLSRLTGEIKTHQGPAMALLDPRKEVFVRRVLSNRQARLWFPGNEQALQYNKELSALREGSSDFARERVVKAKGVRASSILMAGLAADVGQVQMGYAPTERAVSEFAGDQIERKEKFTPPRSIHLDTKYDGAVLVNVWTGFAVQVISKTGNREVVVGPAPRVLDYNETLEVVSLSTGMPKSFKQPVETVYLRVKNNRVSDEVKVETADLVNIKVKLSYRVNFEGDKEKWFSVENYVGLLTERIRSILKSRMKQMKVREFMADSVAIIRDSILGLSEPMLDAEDGEVQKPGGRLGLRFPENDMHVYDVEVLDVEVGDITVSDLLTKAQEQIVRNEIDLDTKEQRLELTKRIEEIDRELAAASHVSRMENLKLHEAERKAKHENALTSLKDDVLRRVEEKTVEEAHQAIKDLCSERGIIRTQAEIDQALAEVKSRQQIELDTAEKLGEVAVKKVEAVTPDLIAAMQVLGDKVLTTEAVKELGAVAAITGDSVEGVFKRLMQGSVLADVFTGDGAAKASGIAARAVERSGLRRGAAK